MTTTVIGLGDLRKRPRRVALVGNPNVGKSSLFNALTGRRQRVSNYPGTTVERVTGSCDLPGGGAVEVIDLPGTYSLLAHSPDEAVVRDELLGGAVGAPRPDVCVVVLDATNVERNLFLATQVFELGIPCVVALNQCDQALSRGMRIDPVRLAAKLGVLVVPTCGRTGQGRDALAEAIASGGATPRDLLGAASTRSIQDAVAAAARVTGAEQALSATRWSRPGALGRALLSETDFTALVATLAASPAVAEQLAAARNDLAAAGHDVVAGAALARYAVIEGLVADVAPAGGDLPPWQRRLDRWLTHPVGGTAALLAVFAAFFALVFKGCEPLMGLVEDALGAVGTWANGAAGGGLLGDFLEKGLVGGFAGFLVFVPQIAVVFLCLDLLDDTGYLARAAFLLDRVMGRFGLPGRAFLPLLSGFACAIPGILAARTISNVRDRFVTMAVLPLMSCSARLPVYFLLIGAVFAGASPWLRGGVLVAMYTLGIVVAMACSSVLRRTAFRGGRTPLMLELPPYRAPSIVVVLRSVARRTWSFVAGAGPIIVALTAVLWALLTFPQDDPVAAAISVRAAAAETDEERASLELQANSAQVAGSYLGQAGQWIEPAVEPLGFDWKGGVAILASFAAREVFVPTLGVVYSVGEIEGDDEATRPLRDSMRSDVRADGRRVWTPLSAVSLMVFYVIALQCMSTLAVLRREMGSWRWPIGLFVGYTLLAYAASLAVFQAGRALGW